MTEPTRARADALGTDGSERNLLVVNSGDAAFLQLSRFHEQLLPAESLFLRLICYLAFVDEIAIPTRLILDSDPLMEAVDLAAPLLRSGLIRPERRDGCQSYLDVAVQRGLGDLARERARRLDELTERPRIIVYGELQQTYIDVLRADLGRSGCFRRTVPGGKRGRSATALDRALERYTDAATGTPEDFASSVSLYAPHLREKALRWAMARYYVTPTLFDDRNLREIPKPAAKLLLSARAKDEMTLSGPTPAPVELMLQQLSVSLRAHEVRLKAERYCAAALEVRSRLPEARRLTASILTTAEAHTVSREVSEIFQRELERQRFFPPPRSTKFLLVSTLVGGALGILADFLVAPGVSLPLGVGSGVATDRVQRALDQRARRRAMPWVVAVEEMERILRSS